MQYIKLFFKSGGRLFLFFTAAAAVLCAAADFYAALAAGAALTCLSGTGGKLFPIFGAILFWLIAQWVFCLISNRWAERTVYLLKSRVLKWFLKENGEAETAKTLCSFGISRQVWFFMHRYLSVWMTVLTFIICLVFLLFTEPIAALMLLCWGAVYLLGSFLLSRLAMKKQVGYGKAYTEKMGHQYELLNDAEGVRSRGDERFVVSRLISLWRKFRKEELSLYHVFSATRLGNILLTVLGACLFCLSCHAGHFSAQALGILLYVSLLLLPSLRHIFRKGPWIEKNKEICAQLLDIANGEAAE